MGIKAGTNILATVTLPMPWKAAMATLTSTQMQKGAMLMGTHSKSKVSTRKRTTKVR
jgi:hypothetical protein